MYQIMDTEVKNLQYRGRFASPFHPENFIVAYGWKNAKDTTCSWQYSATALTPDQVAWYIPDDVTVLVGHNLRFDLMWVWNHPTLIKFIERGGKIWCTQYVEYILGGFDETVKMNTLESVSLKYGGTKKLDLVKIMWEQGITTDKIPEDILVDYLVGSEEEGRDGGDIGNTERVYLAQLKQVQQQGLMPIVEARMDGYLATTEMEYNGLFVDQERAAQDKIKLEQELLELENKLRTFTPGVPDGAEFNWSSSTQLSAYLFGGYVKYSWSAPYIDPDTGELARSQEEHAALYLPDGTKKQIAACTPKEILSAKRVLSGVKKGQIKTCKIKLPTGNIKNKAYEEVVHFPQLVRPDQSWLIATTDARGGPCYSCGNDTIEALAGSDVEAVSLLGRYKRLSKILGTYYSDKEAKKSTGMLACIRDDTSTVNHSLLHVSTATGRTSGRNPNSTNIPRADTAPVKYMFRSRYNSGHMIEVDYSQLEVVVQGYLTRDPNLVRDLKNGVDFHVKRVALKHGLEYSSELVQMCKDKHHPDYDKWSRERTKCKEFSFQNQYGAGAASISLSTGMSVEEVQAIKDAEDAEYPVAAQYHKDVQKHLTRTAQPLTIHLPNGGVYSCDIGYWETPTGTRYAFRSERAPAWLRERDGVEQSFKPTKIKNYPTQGTGAEIIQVCLGVLFRRMVERGWWSMSSLKDKPLLVNTVHDCVWADAPEGLGIDTTRLIVETLGGARQIYIDKFGIDMGVDYPVSSEMGPNMAELEHIEV